MPLVITQYWDQSIPYTYIYIYINSVIPVLWLFNYIIYIKERITCNYADMNKNNAKMRRQKLKKIASEIKFHQTFIKVKEEKLFI